MKEKKYTVKEFCKKYNDASAGQIKETIIVNVMNTHYVPYEMKVTICEKIIESSYYIKDNKNGIETKKLHINSPVQYLLYCLEMIRQYTCINIDFNNVTDEFNMLNQYGILDEIMNLIPEKEIKEFNMILDMMRSDVLQNEYETHAFINNQVERFGELVGFVLNPAIDRLSEIVSNMDEKTVDKLINSFEKLSKFNILK